MKRYWKYDIETQDVVETTDKNDYYSAKTRLQALQKSREAFEALACDDELKNIARLIKKWNNPKLPGAKIRAKKERL